MTARLQRWIVAVRGLVLVAVGIILVQPVPAQQAIPVSITLDTSEGEPAPAVKCPDKGTDEKQVRKIVGEYLKEEAERKKKDEEQQKAIREAQGVEVGSDLGLVATWKDGPFLETRNKDFFAAFHGRFDLDSAWFVAGQQLQTGPGGVGELRDGVDFRRARLRLDGAAYEVFTWVAEFDFAFAQEGETRHVGITDLYWDVTRMPVLGSFRVGHMREPFSMESLTSGLALPFLERSAAFEAFCPFRNTGAMFMNSALGDRMTWAVGAYRTNSRNTGNPSDFGDGEWAGTGRVTFLPIYDADGFYLLHLGAAYSHRGFNPDNDPARLRSFPSLRTGRYIFADTGPIAAESVDLANLEAAIKFGPFVLQSEYYHARINEGLVEGAKRDPSFYGWYVQATWLLTGEEHQYRRSVPTTNPAVFDRPRPFENFFFVKTEDEGPWWRKIGLGRGAWEVGARYCYVNLDDPSQGVDGQIYQDVTLGLNWYLTINTKIQWNYILAHRDFPAKDNEGVAHIFAMRFHHDF